MSKELEALHKLRNRPIVVVNFGDNRKTDYDNHKEEYDTIEKALKDYSEIKEIAKQYNWDNFTKEIFNINTDKKYQDLFRGAITFIQEDYRKARALEIIKKKRVNIYYLEMWWLEKHTYEQYVKDYKDCDWGTLSEELLTQEEYDLLKEVLL